MASRPSTGKCSDNESVVTLNRRRLLQATGGVLAASLAGCSGIMGGNGDDPIGPQPAYADWVAADDLPESVDSGTPLFITRTDFRALSELDTNDGNGEPFGSLEDTVDDAGQELITGSLTGTIVFVLAASFGMVPYGTVGQGAFSGIVSEDNEDSPHTVETGYMVGSTVVLTGEYDVEALLSDVQGFEQVDEREGYQVYEGAPSEDTMINTEGHAFAVSEDAAIFAIPGNSSEDSEGSSAVENGLESVERRIDASAGEVETAVEASEDFDWVLRAGGNGTFVTAGYGKDELEPEGSESDGGTGNGGSGEGESQFNLERIEAQLENATMFAMTSSFDVEAGSANGALGIVYDSSDDVPSESDVQAFVETATDSTVTVEDDRVAVSGTWEDLGF